MTLKEKLDKLFPEGWEDLDQEIMIQVIKEKLLERMQKQLEKEYDLFFSSSNESGPIGIITGKNESKSTKRH